MSTVHEQKQIEQVYVYVCVCAAYGCLLFHEPNLITYLV